MNLKAIYDAVTTPKEERIKSNERDIARAAWLKYPYTGDFLKDLELKLDSLHKEVIDGVSQWDHRESFLREKLIETKTIERIIKYARTGNLNS